LRNGAIRPKIRETPAVNRFSASSPVFIHLTESFTDMIPGFVAFCKRNVYNNKKGGLWNVIKNLLLDLGNVTLLYDPNTMAAPWVENEADRDEIVHALFLHPDWSKGDDGSLTETQMHENARGRLPKRLHPALSNVIAHWPEYMTPLPGAEEFLIDMKARGLKLYALSNAPTRYADFKANYPILKLFDGEVISALIGRAKPSRTFFEYALETFDLNPSECLFVDDLAHNAAGAEACGIEAVVFHGDFDQLRAVIEQRNAA
jgi:putative hydrolase of the HAD superfamily